MYSGFSAMKTKLQIIRQSINPFSGINFVIAELNRIGIPQLINNRLGKRVKQAKYAYSDILLTWIYSNLCGAERLEDTVHLKEHFLNIPKFKFCSPDRIAGVFKSLSSFNIKIKYKEITSKYKPKRSPKEFHEFNINKPLNKLLIETALHTKVIKKNMKYTLDYDNYVVPTEKFDSKMTYKDFYGYNPAVSFIGKIPVYIEGRNGNTPAQVKISETIGRSFKILKEYNITPSRFRSDAGAYHKDVIYLMDKLNMEFFIRASSTRPLFKNLENLQWKEFEKDGYKYETASFEYTPFDKINSYRFVVTRNIAFKRKQINFSSQDDSVYRFIITNNREMTEEQVFHFYNARGSMERNFDTLGNDFNWKRVPFSYLNYNTSFLIIGAITNILYEYIIRKFSTKLHFVNKKQRLKSFIFQFISVAGHWIITTTGMQLELFTMDKDYNNIWMEGCFESG